MHESPLITHRPFAVSYQPKPIAFREHFQLSDLGAQLASILFSMWFPTIIARTLLLILSFFITRCAYAIVLLDPGTKLLSAFQTFTLEPDQAQ
jgi:hypothetical protein